MSVEDTLVISFLLNFVLFSLILLFGIVIKKKLWEFFKIGWKLWRDQSKVLVARVHNSGNVKLTVESLKNKMPFGVSDRDDVVINKKIYQKVEDISDVSLEEREKQLKEEAIEKKIDPGRLRLANGVPFVVLKQDFHENLDLVNLFKPDLDSQQVNDAISQAYEDGFKDGEGNKSDLERITTYTMYITVGIIVFTMMNLALIYMNGENIGMALKTLSSIQGQITALAETTISNSAVEFN